MRRTSTLFLQCVLVLVGLAILAFMLVEPTREGRNAHATLFQVYFNDPFLAYAYTASIAFFVALWQAFKLLGFARRNEIISPSAVRALRTIRFCGIALVCFLLGAELYFGIVTRRQGEDIAGGVMMGLILIFISMVITTAAAVLERTMRSAVELKSENDLTV